MLILQLELTDEVVFSLLACFLLTVITWAIQPNAESYRIDNK